MEQASKASPEEIGVDNVKAGDASGEGKGQLQEKEEIKELVLFHPDGLAQGSSSLQMNQHCSMAVR